MVNLIVSKLDVQWLHANGFISPDQVGVIWEQLFQRCSSVPSQAENSGNNNNISQEQRLEIPPVEGNWLEYEELKNDLCITYSKKNGSKLAKRILEGIRKRSTKTAMLAYSEEDPFDSKQVEKSVATSSSLVVLLTKDCLKQIEVVYSMLVAKFYYQHPSLVILVHDAESCFFPGYDEQPESVKEFFSEKAVTFLGCTFNSYPEEGIDEIVSKYQSEIPVLDHIMSNFKQNPVDAFLHVLSKNEYRQQIPVSELQKRMKPFMNQDQLKEFVEQADANKDGVLDPKEAPKLVDILKQRNVGAKSSGPEHEEEDITTRVFLSHKRSTGQGIAGRFYEGLKQDYKVFIDSEAKFKIHNLKAIVQNTDAFVFLLTYGILLSKWCLEELKSAIENKKRVIVVRELSYQLPDVLPPEWKEVEPTIRNSPELVWLAEYNTPCLKALKKFIGSPDSHWRASESHFSNSENQELLNGIIEQAKTNDTFDFNCGYQLPEGPYFADALLDHVLQVVPATTIKHLKFKDFPGNNTDVLEYLLNHLPHLQSIDITSTHFTNPLIKIVSLTLDNLTSLRLADASITDASILFLSQYCGQLRRLELANCPNLNRNLFTHCLQLANLEHLGIEGNIKKAKNPVDLPAKLTNLKSFAVRRNFRFEISDLEKVVRNNPGIQELDLEALWLEDSFFPLLLAHVPNLQKINVRYSRLPANFLQEIPNLKNLKEIIMSSVLPITEETIQSFQNELGIQITVTQDVVDAGVGSAVPVLITETNGTKLFHVYGYGVLEEFDTSAPVRMIHSEGTHYYYTLDQSRHPCRTCPECSLLHIWCRFATFNDEPNVFFVSEDYFEHQAKPYTDAVIDKVEQKGELNLNGFCGITGLPLSSVIDYIQDIVDIAKITKLQIQTNPPFSGSKCWSFDDYVTLLNAFPSVNEFMAEPDDLKDAVELAKAVRPNLRGVTFTEWQDMDRIYALQAILQVFPNLERLAMSTIKSDWANQYLEAFAGFKQLKELELARVPQVEDSFYAAIGELTKLTRLNLCCSASLGDAQLALLVSLENLEYLDLFGCQITKQGIQDIVCKNFPKLKKLGLSPALLADSELISILIESHPNLAGTFILETDTTNLVDAFPTFVRSWFPGIMISKSNKEALVHVYGVGNEVITPLEENLAPFASHVAEYGTFSKMHDWECDTCKKMHPAMKDMLFGGKPNEFFSLNSASQPVASFNALEDRPLY